MAAGVYETSLNIFQATRRHIHTHCRENFKFFLFSFYSWYLCSSVENPCNRRWCNCL